MPVFSPDSVVDCMDKYIHGSMNLLSDITLNQQVLGTSLEYIKLASDLCAGVNGWIPAWKVDPQFLGNLVNARSTRNVKGRRDGMPKKYANKVGMNVNLQSLIPASFSH